MTMLTVNEKKFLLAITNKSNFTGEKLDFNLTAEQNQLIDEWSFWDCWADAVMIAAEHGYKINSVKGYLGSLLRKGYISIDDGTGCGNEVMINREQFNKIKSEL